jgi:nucleotide-binding universal stress UspA family protein
MVDRPSVLCPVDFSAPSRGALRYAVALAEHFYGSLTVATVNDPLLTRGADIEYGSGWLLQDSRRALAAFVDETLQHHRPIVAELNVEVAVGKPASEVLRIAAARHVDLIVMSTHGFSGVRKLFLGSTAERVLRETTVPVLVTPAAGAGPESLEAVTSQMRCVLAPLDLTAVSPMQMRIASGLAEAFRAALVVVHVFEPWPSRPGHEALIAHLRRCRQIEAVTTLDELLGRQPSTVHASVVTAEGDPAEEIARLADRCQASVVVMGLHAATGRGMGSVTYRLLTRSATLTLALPPELPHHTITTLACERPQARPAAAGEASARP